MTRIVAATDENLERAAELLRAGELVCFPTETVYGLGADASNPEAVKRVFAAKGRPADHPLIVHIAAAGILGDWAETVPEEANLLAERFWPGPLTLVLRRSARVPPEVTGGQETVALRVPAHPVAKRLLERFGSGLAAPSANLFGRISPTSAQHAASELEGRVALIVDGGSTEVGVESTIVDLSGDTPTILRPGMIGRRALSEALGRDLAGEIEREAPRVPGSHARHYSPDSPLEMVEAGRLEAMSNRSEVSVLSTMPAPGGYRGRWLQLPTDPHGYARALYAALRELDRLGRPILVEQPPEGEEWGAIGDRLRRASAGRQLPAEGRAK